MDKLISVNDIDLFFEDTGGMPLLLVHGFPMDHTMWEKQLTGLGIHERILAPDLRGFGKSTVPTRPYDCYSMDAYATDLRNLLDALSLQQVILVGLSMGGYIAFAFHRLFPERLKGLVLVDTRPTEDTPDGKQGRLDAIEKVRQGGVKMIADDMIPKLFSLNTLKNNRSLVEKVRDMMTRQPPGGVIGALHAMAERPDSTPDLPGIQVPTLVVVGADDKLTPPEDAMGMARNIRNARLEIIPGAGHLTPLEAPGPFNRTLREFISELK